MKKWALPCLFCFIFVFSGLQLTYNYVQRFYCQCRDSSCGSLLSEATDLPTAPQPRPNLLSPLYLCVHLNKLMRNPFGIEICARSFSLFVNTAIYMVFAWANIISYFGLGLGYPHRIFSTQTICSCLEFIRRKNSTITYDLKNYCICVFECFDPLLKMNATKPPPPAKQLNKCG